MLLSLNDKMFGLIKGNGIGNLSRI